jgi:hypothetical protein
MLPKGVKLPEWPRQQKGNKQNKSAGKTCPLSVIEAFLGKILDIKSL